MAIKKLRRRRVKEIMERVWEIMGRRRKIRRRKCTRTGRGANGRKDKINEQKLKESERVRGRERGRTRTGGYTIWSRIIWKHGLIQANLRKEFD